MKKYPCLTFDVILQRIFENFTKVFVMIYSATLFLSLESDSAKFNQQPKSEKLAILSASSLCKKKREWIFWAHFTMLTLSMATRLIEKWFLHFLPKSLKRKKSRKGVIQFVYLRKMSLQFFLYAFEL